MKIEILKTVVDSFIDFSGTERKFVVAAVAQKSGPLTKAFGIGFSICNPADEFNEEIGTQIAVNKALKQDNKLFAYVNCNGFLTPEVVNLLIDQEITYFKRKPSSHIAGYNTMKEKYERDEEAQRNMTNFINNYGEIMQKIMNLNKNEKQLVLKLINEN